MGIPVVRWIRSWGLGNDFEMGGDLRISRKQSELDGVGSVSVRAPPYDDRMFTLTRATRPYEADLKADSPQENAVAAAMQFCFCGFASIEISTFGV
jgi:hypothetical protein